MPIMTAAVIVIILMLIQPMAFISEGDPAPDEGSSWTFLAYMSADVPGSPLNWTDDVNEMEDGLLTEEITILALVDPEGIGDSRVYEVQHDAQESDELVSQVISNPAFIPSDGEVNMGDPNTLTAFASFIMDSYYQGGRFAIIFWGHGNGWYGVAQDRGDYLEPTEMLQALSSIEEMLDEKVNLLIFDACSMGSMEVLSLLPSVARFAVFSEIPVPAYGMPYDTIFDGISMNPSTSTESIARRFSDDYVEFGSLISGITSQAAVANLEKLENASETLRLFIENCTLFMPISRADFEDARNISNEVDAASTIDLRDYISHLIADEQIPRRLKSMAERAAENLSDAIIANRIFISPLDFNNLTSALYGISIFFPYDIVPGEKYENVSDAAKSWKHFLEEFHNGSYPIDVNLSIDPTLEDRRFNDGLTDTILLQWNEAPDLTKLEFEIVCISGSIPEIADSAPSIDRNFVIDCLEPEIYDIYIYGIGGEGEYLSYEKLDSIIILRRYTYSLNIGDLFVPNGIFLTVKNLENGANYVQNVSAETVTLSFIVPEPNNIGDRILMELFISDEVVARGLLLVGEDENSSKSLITEQTITPLSQLLSIFLISGLLVFSFAKIMAIGKQRKLKSGRASMDLSSPSESRKYLKGRK